MDGIRLYTLYLVCGTVSAIILILIGYICMHVWKNCYKRSKSKQFSYSNTEPPALPTSSVESSQSEASTTTILDSISYDEYFLSPTCLPRVSKAAWDFSFCPTSPRYHKFSCNSRETLKSDKSSSEVTKTFQDEDGNSDREINQTDTKAEGSPQNVME